MFNGSSRIKCTPFPVKLEIKKETGETGNLYVVVEMTKIKRTSVMGSEVRDSNEPSQPLPVTDSTYSLQPIVSEINPIDRDFLKYLPNKMLSEEQITAKKEALIAEKEKFERILEKSRRILDDNYMDTAIHPEKLFAHSIRLLSNIHYIKKSERVSD